MVLQSVSVVPVSCSIEIEHLAGGLDCLRKGIVVGAITRHRTNQKCRTEITCERGGAGADKQSGSGENCEARFHLSLL